MIRLHPSVCLALLVGAAFGGLLFGPFANHAPPAALAADAAQPEQPPMLASLESEVAMVVADYHASNLWWAGRSQNWPLADYYWNEVTDHMELSTQVELTGEQKADVQKALASVRRTPSMQVGQAIRKGDIVAFQASYRSLLGGCNNCHKAAGKPFLRVRTPAPPSSSMISFEPAARGR